MSVTSLRLDPVVILLILSLRKLLCFRNTVITSNLTSLHKNIPLFNWYTDGASVVLILYNLRHPIYVGVRLDCMTVKIMINFD